MTARDGFTRLVDTWLAEEGTPTTPDYLDLVLDRTSTTRQRPVWLSPGRWLPVNTTTLNPRAWSIPPVARFGLLAALLIALAIAAVALYAGSQRHRVPSPFGPAANGQLYFDVDGTVVATNPDGSGRRIVDVGVPASGPYLSPDGTRLAFVALDPENGFRERVLVADSDGSSSHVISGDLQPRHRSDNQPDLVPRRQPAGFWRLARGSRRAVRGQRRRIRRPFARGPRPVLARQPGMVALGRLDRIQGHADDGTTVHRRHQARRHRRTPRTSFRGGWRWLSRLSAVGARP